jgi:hypothetical protein
MSASNPTAIPKILVLIDRKNDAIRPRAGQVANNYGVWKLPLTRAAVKLVLAAH